VVIRASSSRQVDALLADLASPLEVTRESAVARLIVIGPRAVQRLVACATSEEAATDSRIAALHALEGIADLRALDPALVLLDHGDEGIAVAAIGVVQAFLAASRGMTALDRLSALAVDRSRGRGVRLAAIRALRGVGQATIDPLLQALGVDPDAAVALAAGLGPEAAADPVQQLKDAAEGPLPAHPAPLRLALAEGAEQVAPVTLHRLIEQVRIREGAESGPIRSEWMALRATAHALLGQRGSRLALYDLRETLESARDPLPVEFLGAAASIGDVSCLEPIAAAYARSAEGAAHADQWWRERLIDVFRAIATREGLSRRHAVGKRIAVKWRHAATRLWP
jgi:hypothetical protein